MKTSILAILLCLTGVFAQAAPVPVTRLAYVCDQKHGHHQASIYWTGEDFYICFMGGPMALVPVCEHKVVSEDWDHKGDMITIDFMHGWMFQGDMDSGVLWNSRTSYICERPQAPTNSN